MKKKTLYKHIRKTINNLLNLPRFVEITIDQSGSLLKHSSNLVLSSTNSNKLEETTYRFEIKELL